MGLFDRDDENQPVWINGNALVCPVCGNDHFWSRETQLNTAGMTFLGLDWANVSAKNYVCSECGYMFWFHPIK